MSPILVFLGTFLFMEAVTWFTHKYIMHGFLWVLHEDHHTEMHKVLQKNDWFFIIFAIPSSLSIVYGLSQSVYSLAGFGFGIMAYGFAYFWVHEVIIHQRIKLFSKWNHWYIRGIRRAHKMHHKHVDKIDGECFGMLFVPFHYFKTEIKNSKK